MKTLEQIADYYATDKRASDHNYTEVYEKYFEPIRYEKLKILEIGILNHPHKEIRPFEGASLKLWKDYFENSIIYGLDINDHTAVQEDRVKVYIGDQGDRNQLKKIMDEIGEVDIIIEDGSHFMHHQQISLGFLFKYIKRGGIFVIEDLHTSYPKPPFDPNGYRLSESDTRTIDMLRGFISSRNIISQFIEKDEIEYLEQNIAFCKIENPKDSEIAFIKKK